MYQRSQAYAQILSRMIRCKTISVMEENRKFEDFHSLVKELFPNLFRVAEYEDVDGSILLRWKGSDPSLAPVLLMNHHDVVEASGQWTHDAFSGDIADGKVWGRGALDTKGGLSMMLQAAEELAESGFAPKRDTYFVSSCCEETTGDGGDRISQLLLDRGIRLHMVLDEGGMILYDPIGGADGTFAMIGVGEKGYVDLKFTARSIGGHASTPGKNTPLARLGKFMNAVDDSKIFEVKMSATVKEMLRRFAPTMKGVMKVACGNVGLFRPLLCKIMPAISPSAAALLRTTLAFTMAKGSEGTNVLPQEAWIVGNMRYSHHQGRDASIEAVTKLAKKYDIEVSIIKDGGASGLTDFESQQFKFMEQAVSHVFPDFKPVPYIMNGASDSRYFSRVCDHCVRFVPVYIDKQQYASVHAIDENINLDQLPKAVDFYKYFIEHI